MAYTNAQLLTMSNDINAGPVEDSKLPFMANTRWSQEATNATQVTILTVGDVTFAPYVEGTPITGSTPDASLTLLKMDQKDGFGITQYDTEKTVPGYVAAVGVKAGKQAAVKPDHYILNTLLTKALFPTNYYAGVSDAVIEINGANALSILDDLAENLDDTNTDTENRVFICPPSIATKIRIGMRKAGLVSEPITNIILNRPAAFKVSGFTILTSNQFHPVGGTGTDFNCFYGTVDAIAAGYNPIAIETQRVQGEPADLIFGVLRYGAKVVNEKQGGVAYLQPKAES